MPLRFSHMLGSLAGNIIYLANGRERKTTETNLQLCYPDLAVEKRHELTKQSLKETAKWAFETGAVWFREEDWRNKYIRQFHNLDLFEAAVKDERGLLLLMPHFGNWELAGTWAAEHAKTTAIYRTPKIEDLDPLVRNARARSKNTTLVPATARGVMAVFKALRAGEMTVILPDQVPVGDGGVYAEFFAIPAYTQTLVYNLIQKTNPIVLQIYALRRQGYFELGFMQPDKNIYSEEAEVSARALNKTIEQLCALGPAQYQWEYKRFKNQLDGKDYYL